VSGNNPYGNQPNEGRPNQGPQGQPTPPGPSFGGPAYPGPAYGQGQPPSGPYGQPTPSGPYPPQYGQGVPQGPGGPQGPGSPGGGPQQGPGGPGGPGGPQQPYGMYGPGQPQQPKKSNKLPLIIGAAVLALVLVGTIIGVAVVRGGGDEPAAGGGAGGGGTSSAPAESKLPSDAVRGYLEALAAGDAQTALSYASTAPSDTTFLTNEVLAASLKAGPITAINVPEVNDKYTYSVAASYKIGNQAVNADFPVEQEGDAWKLREVAYDLTLSSSQNKTLPMLINGVTVEADKAAVFPGTYAFTTGLDNIGYGKNNKLVVKSVSDYPEGMSEIQPTITSAGEKAFTKAVEDSLDKCMKSKKIKNENCPNTFDQITGAQPDNGTLKWSYDKDALDNMKIRLDYSNPVIAETNLSLGIKATAECDGSPCRLTSYGNPDPSGNLTKDPIKITWE
jgi:hypothetical protein